MSRSQFEPINYKGLEDHHVPHNIELSVGEIVRLQSVVNGQGFEKCNCKGTCLKSCSCFKKGMVAIVHALKKLQIISVKILIVVNHLITKVHAITKLQIIKVS